MPDIFDPNAPANAEGIFGLPDTPEDSRVVLLPVPWEATVSYGSGTGDGPAAILRASRQVDLLDRDTGKPYESGIAMLPISQTVRAWSDEAKALAATIIENGATQRDAQLEMNLGRVNDLGRLLNGWVASETRAWLQCDKIVGIVGGDHSVPLGAISAIADKHPGLGILHIDAHADLRIAYEGFTFSHASIMDNVIRDIPTVSKLVQVGIRDYCEQEEEAIQHSAGRIKTFYESDVRRELLDAGSWRRVCNRIVAELPETNYISFDIDGLDPTLCPNTGTPVPGGLSFAEMVLLLRTLVDSGRTIVGFDLVETAPDPTGATEWDGNVAARVLYKMIGFALMSNRGLPPAA
ncbi:MAG: agmatinase family protein [Vicinamibacteria bacterium]|nr:agmatinase family protein [Vicinamibacteria bacterium]